MRHIKSSIFIIAALLVSACGGSGDGSSSRVDGWVSITEPTTAETYSATDITSITLAGDTFRSPNTTYETVLECNCEGWMCLIGDPECTQRTVYDYDTTLTITNITTGYSVSSQSAIYWQASIPVVSGKNLIVVSAYDSSGNGGTTQITVYVSDTIPPTLSSTQPSNNTTGIAVTTTINARFSEAMDTGSITTSNFTLDTSGNNVSGMLSFSDGGRVATFMPSSNLLYDTSYTATLGTGIKDLVGLSLLPATWSFKTGFVDPPLNVHATAGNGEITLSWDAVMDADEYNVYFSMSPDLNLGNGTRINATGITTTTFTHTGLTNGADYYYIFTASNSAGESQASSIASTIAGLHWLKQFGTPEGNFGTAIAVDASGNSYIIGSTEGDLAGTGTAGLHDVFIARYNNVGDREWINQFGSIYIDSGADIAVDANGNSYITGRAGYGITGTGVDRSSLVFIAKYDSDGNRVWLKQFGNPTTASVSGRSIAVDAFGNSYVTGYTKGDLTGEGNAGETDVFITKFDSSGNQLWVKQFGTVYQDSGEGIAVDSNGNSYLIGSTGTWASSVLIASYDTDGNQRWQKEFSSSGFDEGSDIALDADGNLYLVGTTYGTFPGNLNAGYADIFVSKHDNAGSLLWVNQFGSISGEQAYSVAVTPTGTSYLTGYTADDLEGSGANEGDDAIIASFDTSGNLLWLNQFGSNGRDYPNGITLDNNGFIYLTGSTSGDLAGTGNAGEVDVFIERIYP